MPPTDRSDDAFVREAVRRGFRVQEVGRMGNAGGGPAELLARTVDAPVLGYALALSIVTGLVFGIVPALRHSRLAQGEFLRQGTASPLSRLKDVLVVAEMVAHGITNGITLGLSVLIYSGT